MARWCVIKIPDIFKILKISMIFAMVLIFLTTSNVVAYSIDGGGVCTCINCTDCTNALNDNTNCSRIVRLNTSITNHSGTCITNPVNFSNKIFDCQGFTIDGVQNYGAHGIHISNKTNITIRNCIINDFWEGIGAYYLTNSLITNNTFYNHRHHGLYLRYSSHNNITNNTANYSAWSFGLWSYCYHNIIVNNTATNGVVIAYAWEKSENNTVFNNLGYRNSVGIWVFDSFHNRVFNNTAFNNLEAGIRVDMYSQHNNVTNNTVFNNPYGIYIVRHSTNNSIFNNTMYNNTYGFYTDTTVANNTINWNIICGNIIRDIENNGTGTTGDNNTCNTFLNYNDTNTTGCTYECVEMYAPYIEFVPPTPANGSRIGQNYIYVNVSSSDVSKYSVFLDWNYSLVGYWAMDWHNATGVFDNSTYKNFGTFHEGIGADDITTGRRGKALSFDGVNDFLGVPHHLALDSRFVSIEAWVYLDSWAGRSHPSVVTRTSYTLQASADGGTMQFWILSAGAWRVVQVPFTPGEWTHIVGTYDGTTMRIYKNAVEGSTTLHSGTIDSTISPVNIGRDLMAPVPGRHWLGTIDEVRIYNRALSPEEIRASYNAGLHRFQRNFTNLSEGIYRFKAFAIDKYGNFNSTELREVEFSPCFCVSCSDCMDKLNDPICRIVKLTANITNHPGTCINNPVNFSNKTFDCQGYNIDGTGLRTYTNGIVIINKHNNTIKNCIFSDWRSGLYIEGGTNIIVINNTAYSNFFGLSISGFASNCTITNNNASNNYERGIAFGLNHSIISNNIANDNRGHAQWAAGLMMLGGYYNLIINNTMINNLDGGITIWYDVRHNAFINNTFINNTRSGIYADGLGFIFFNNTFINNTINGNLDGFRLLTFFNNTIKSNTISRNMRYGVFYQAGSNNNTLIANIICDNTVRDIHNGGINNTGDNNTCNTTFNYNDTGTTGCKYKCIADVNCTCINCTDCTDKLNNPLCSQVYLLNNGW